jgi:hypothetical protein
MPSFIVRNENYRDEVLKFSYPFDERSTLENDQIFIGTDLLLDAIIYLKEPAELPLYISEIDGTYGTPTQVRLFISDNTGTVVATTTVEFKNCYSDVISTRGVSVGTFVFYAPALQRFISRTVGKVFQLLPTVASLSLDATYVAKTSHLRYVAAGEAAAEGNVRIVARHGVKWEVSDEGRLSLNIVGDRFDVLGNLTPIKSVNGVANKSIWLAGHPRANLRLSVENGQIVFTQAKEATT